MKCRTTITGRKIWNDNDDQYNSRPPFVNINLLRDGELYKSITADAANNWVYTFACLPVWQNSSHKYSYRIEEPVIPGGYTSERNGYNIVNTLREITITGTKTWNDNNNQFGERPAEITVSLIQNGQPFRSVQVLSPPDEESMTNFNFENVPVFDNDGNPFIYTVDEDDLNNYTTTVDGFNITNAFAGFGFSFLKINAVTAMAVQNAVFELRNNGRLIGRSASTPEGLVSFSGIQPGIYQMSETVPPVGYMSDTTIYQVAVTNDGKINIDGLPVGEFTVKNAPKTSVSGSKIWNDNENPDDTRPSTVLINLYRDESLFRQTAVLTTEMETPFVFDDLPQYGSEGTAYNYTVAEDTVPEGYDTSVNGTQIENKIREFTITVAGVGENEKFLYAFPFANQPYGSSFTFHAPNVSGYTALEPTDCTFTHLTQNEEYHFHYEKLSTP